MEQIDLKPTSKEYKYFMSHGGKEILKELQDYFGKDNAGIAMATCDEQANCFINIILGRLVEGEYKNNKMFYSAKDEDYKKLPEKLKDYKMNFWGILSACQDIDFKVGDRIIKKEDIIKELKLNE